MVNRLKHCRHSFCEVTGSPHYNEEICCAYCEDFAACEDRCTDDDHYCKDERRAWRNAIIGIAVAAVLIFGYLAIFTACEWRYLTTPPETAFEEVVAYADFEQAAVMGVPAPVEFAPNDETQMLARLIYGEAGGIPSTMERAAVVWCVLNRVDDPGYPTTIEEVVTQPNQFYGYNAAHPATVENIAIAQDVLMRWKIEKLGVGNGGRILPADYVWFTGDGKRNYFEEDYHSGSYWDWSIPNPYED